VITFAEAIRTKAIYLGFAKCGIIPAIPFDDEGERLNTWLRNGFHADMAWMEKHVEKRADPTLLFDGARSIVSVAMNYYTPHEHSDEEAAGKISRYAWGDDYHSILKDRLDELLVWIREKRPEANGKVCVDTAPLMDKAVAVRAGLGWIGKHSNLITREVGSWVFLGSLLLDIELDHDATIVEDHCGTCTACLDACPTSAIVEPYVVDSNKCISYATIELRDDKLPEAVAEHLNGWMYGCDICQDVCPWNRFEQPTSEIGFEPREGETSLSLEAIDRMEHEEYVERFRGSAIKRAKLAGLKRNAKHLSK
jgi:epoxyqueuosine reductase